jgi:hypothetical protein
VLSWHHLIEFDSTAVPEFAIFPDEYLTVRIEAHQRCSDSFILKMVMIFWCLLETSTICDAMCGTVVNPLVPCTALLAVDDSRLYRTSRGATPFDTV